MASLAKMMWVVLVVMVPGGLLLLCGYLLARVMRHSWQLEHDSAGPLRLRRAFAAVRVRDVWREARAVL